MNSIERIEWVNIESVDQKLIDSFRSGNDLFDNFLSRDAQRWQDAGEAATYIIADGEEIRNKCISNIWGYATINATGLLRQENDGEMHYLSCAEIRMFAVARALRRHGDPTNKYSDAIFNLVLQNLYAMAVHNIGFRGIFLNANHEGERLYKDAGFNEVTSFIPPTAEDKVDIRDTKPMLIMINDDFIGRIFSPIEV